MGLGKKFAGVVVIGKLELWVGGRCLQKRKKYNEQEK